MASPCELLLDLDEEGTARQLLEIAAAEAWRVERKFSRYRHDNIVHAINTRAGQAVRVDTETAALLDYATHCHTLSEGRFDISSGILRRVWTFDGSEHIPAPGDVLALLPHVGWQHAEWRKPWLRLQPGMEIDLGGIGKEYAVDRTAQLLRRHTHAGLLINFGGDVYATGPRRNGAGWRVGIEDPDGVTDREHDIEIACGGIATSGDSRRFLYKDGVRYSHILDPRTGWPVADAPRSVTVAAATCTEAGVLATLASLHGINAERFLQEQAVSNEALRYWCRR